MDYTREPFSFRIKKAWRYTRLYGPRRTAAKVRAQYHMQRAYKVLPSPADRKNEQAHVGVIGCGNFAFSTIAYFLRKNYGEVIRGAMDIDINRAASLAENYRCDYFSNDSDRLLEDPRIDLVYIASNHASHAEYAIAALEHGKAVHIEKPHVVNENQLRRLCSTMERCSPPVALGFNRPGSALGLTVKRLLDEQTGPAMLNWFVAGHEIPPDHWYFREEEGGRVLGNLCHWTDFIYQLVPSGSRFPVVINPTRAQQADCDIAVAYVFGDKTVGSITFSAKGHAFEGVRERFGAHRGNTILALDDFRTLVADIGDAKHSKKLLFRDHGHETSIRRSYEMVRPSGLPSNRCSTSYVWETGRLFLGTKKALDENRQVVLNGDSWITG
jgi:predicted dehydrogenase